MQMFGMRLTRLTFRVVRRLRMLLACLLFGLTLITKRLVFKVKIMLINLWNSLRTLLVCLLLLLFILGMGYNPIGRLTPKKNIPKNRVLVCYLAGVRSSGGWLLLKAGNLTQCSTFPAFSVHLLPLITKTWLIRFMYV